MPATEVLTIGHSNHTVDGFVELLARNGVTAVADVRSAPYSQMYPQFNRESLAAMLKQQGLAYSFLGKELGGRSPDKACYENGRIQYYRVAATAIFRSGIERLLAGTQLYRIALVCAEREPLECHRALLVAPELEKAGVNVIHICADGKTESHADAMVRLLHLHHLAAGDSFLSRSELIEEACYRQQQRVGFAEKIATRNEGQMAR